MAPWLADWQNEAGNTTSFTYFVVHIWSDIKVIFSVACMQQNLTLESHLVL